jgi:exosortase O
MLLPEDGRSVPDSSRHRVAEVGEALAAALLPLAFCVLQAPSISWLCRSLPSGEYFTSLVLLALAGVPVALRAHRVLREERSTRGACLTYSPAAVGLLLAAALASLAAEALWDIHVLSGVLCGVGAYALFGLYVSPARWSSALPAALLLVATLPFGHHLHAYFGFPARMAVASIVHGGFEVLGIPSLTSQTVLLLETFAMNVDLPCSGIRSAWTGLVFFLGATCLERPRLSLRWMLAGVGYLLLLFVANVLRVAVLALLSHAGLPALARLVHEPLGVAGFVLASAAVYGVLRGIGAPPEPAAAQLLPAPRLLAPALAVTLLALAAARRPAVPPEVGAVAEVAFPAGLATAQLPLSEAERDLFSRHGARAQKVRLGGALPGTLILVHARSWRSHHPPEQCLRGGGRAIESDLPLVLPNGLPVRLIRLAGGGVAVWWFQSPSGSVNDLIQRIWAEVSGRESRWTMVSLLLDTLPLGAQGLAPLTTTVSDAVAAFLARAP